MKGINRGVEMYRSHLFEQTLLHLHFSHLWATQRLESQLYPKWKTPTYGRTTRQRTHHTLPFCSSEPPSSRISQWKMFMELGNCSLRPSIEHLIPFPSSQQLCKTGPIFSLSDRGFHNSEMLRHNVAQTELGFGDNLDLTQLMPSLTVPHLCFYL